MRSTDSHMVFVGLWLDGGKLLMKLDDHLVSRNRSVVTGDEKPCVVHPDLSVETCNPTRLCTSSMVLTKS